MVADKEQALHDWAQQNPYLTDKLTFDFIGAHDGNCGISPVSSDTVIKSYIDGTKRRQYVFALMVVLAISDAYDNTNAENILALRKWQSWIDEQEYLKNYPDFGDRCSDFRLENMPASSPSMALRFEGNLAKYQFFAQLTYKEATQNGRR